MPTLRVGQREIEYELRRSSTISERRITVTLGAVEVLTLSTDDAASVASFLHRKRQWLFNTLRDMEEAIARRPVVPRLMSGSKIPYRGRHSTLLVRRHDGPHVEITHRTRFIVDLPEWVSEEAADAVVALELKLWLKRRVRLDVREIVHSFSQRHGLKPRSIRIGEFVTGWGSCGPSGTIHVDWRLVFAPKRVLEYVVAHELAHLMVRSHGPEFWGLLRELLPDYERPKGWLETNGPSLDAGFLERFGEPLAPQPAAR